MSMDKSGYGHDGIFRSLRPPVVIPAKQHTSMISFLFRNVSSYPNKPALIDCDSGETLTFSEFKTTVAKLSQALNTQLGISKNDVVLFFAPNSIQYSVSLFSVIALGAIATTVNPQYTVGELSKQLQDSKPKLIITIPALYQKVESFGLPVVFLGSESPRKGCYSYNDLISTSSSVSELPNVSIGGDDTAALLYSSGTTGVSKGVVLSHMNFISNSQMITSDQRLMGEKDYRFICVLPMFHIAGLATILYSQLQEGNTIISMGKFDFEGLLKNIEKYRATHLWVVPPVILALAKQDAVKKFDLSSLKQIASGAAPLGKELMEECAKKFPHVTVIQDAVKKFDLSSLKQIASGAAPLGKELMEECAKKFLHVMVIQVAPVELEVLLLSHSEILNVVVIPFPNMEAGEVPIAFVVRSPNSSLTEDDVKKFIAEQVSPYKKIEASDICKQCAKSAAGKLLRRELIEKVRSET
ncbi:unnamed protein product [Lactuca saligna]|uniref:4-coumarate--CoA ligase n=1 Tax=Lactuca saligna TaxID=75948 RepID=A0AA35ZCG7_LACSI|nr:unnamed protein product [Lactuca saligna]